MKLIALLCFVGSTFAPGAANEVIPVIADKTRSFTNAEVYKVTTSEVWIKVGAGLARVPLADIAPELQKKFSYDPAKAQAEKQAALDKEAAKREDLRLKLEAKKKAELEQWRADNLRLVDGKEVEKNDLTYFYGNVLAVLKDGILVIPPDPDEWKAAHSVPPPPRIRSDSLSRSGNFLGGSGLSRPPPRPQPVPYPSPGLTKTFFLRVDPSNYSDGKLVDGHALKGKTYQYTAVDGGLRTVDSYTLATPYKAPLGETIDPQEPDKTVSPKPQPTPTADK